MAFNNLKVSPLQRATASWANSVVDALNQLYGNFEEVYRRGTAEDPWELFYGFYGFFEDNVFVQGKPVIKDGDPINLYDIFEPAKDKITQAIDSSKVPTATDVRDLYGAVAKEGTQLLIKKVLEDLYGLQSYTQPSIREDVERIKDRILRINMDNYGNIGVIISEPVDEYGNIKVRAKDPDEELIPAVETIITPSAGKRVDVRRAYVSTNSTGGEIYVKFKNTGKVITAVFPSKYGIAVIPAIRIPGEVDEEVIVEWTGLDSGAKIVYAINYKEI